MPDGGSSWTYWKWYSDANYSVVGGVFRSGHGLGVETWDGKTWAPSSDPMFWRIAFDGDLNGDQITAADAHALVTPSH